MARVVDVVRTFLAVLVLAVVAAAPLKADIAQDGTLCAGGIESYERVIEACTSVINDSSVAPRVKLAAYQRRAEAYAQGIGDFPRAIADASEAIKLDPDEPSGIFFRAQLYLAYNEFEKAIGDFGKVLKLKPEDNDALTGRAYAYVQIGDSDRAIADLGQVIRLKPDNATAYYDRGGAYEKKEDFERARADYNSAIKLQRDYAGEFQESCFRTDEKGERALANWPACDAEEGE